MNDRTKKTTDAAALHEPGHQPNTAPLVVECRENGRHIGTATVSGDGTTWDDLRVVVLDPAPLTETEADVLRALVRMTVRDGYQPSTSELILKTGRPGVHTVLTRIAKKGWIELSGRVRAIRISDEARAFGRDETPAQDAPENEE